MQMRTPDHPTLPVEALSLTLSRPYRERGPEAVRRFAAFLAAAVLSASTLPAVSRAAPPATMPTTAPTSQTSDVEVREWAIFVVDAGQPNASGRPMWSATLPPFMTSRRENAPAGEDNRPTPMGVIRFIGEVEKDAPADVLLTLPNTSDVQATWPKAQVRPNRILWSNVYTDENAKTGDLDSKHWMAPLRKSASALIRSGNQAERFLLYDVQFPYKLPLQLKADKDGTLRATNTGGGALLDLTFYKKQKDNWTRATIVRLAGRPDAAPPAADKKAGPATKPDPNAAFDAAPAAAGENKSWADLLTAVQAKQAATQAAAPATQPTVNVVTARSTTVGIEPDSVTGQPALTVRQRITTTALPAATAPAGDRAATTSVATTRPASGPATVPAADTSAVVSFSPVSGDDATVLSSWPGALTAAGVLPGDVDTVLSILKAHGLSDRWMTAIYRLDPAEMDRLLPMEIVPAPRKITRVGLVIARGFDPSINEEIDRLIKQCGDSDYAKRKAATTELIALGQPAKAKVEKAVNDKDPEISQRAEMILAAIEKKKG